jgi:hypothetical protein
VGPDAGKSCEAEVDKMGDEVMWAGFNDTPFDESVYSPKRNLHCVGFSKPGVGTLKPFVLGHHLLWCQVTLLSYLAHCAPTVYWRIGLSSCWFYRRIVWRQLG